MESLEKYSFPKEIDQSEEMPSGSGMMQFESVGKIADWYVVYGIYDDVKNLSTEDIDFLKSKPVGIVQSTYYFLVIWI